MPSNSKEKSRHAAAKNGGSLISNQKLRMLYSAMLKCRSFDECVSQLFVQKKLSGSYASSIGHEASAVGVAIDLRRTDAITVSRQDSIAQLVKGAPLDVILSQLYANYSKSAEGRAKRNTLEGGSTMAAQLNMVAGLALANKMQKNQSVVVAFVQESAPSLEESREPLNFAAKQQLPILFVTLNGVQQPLAGANGKASSVHFERYDFPCIPVDGHDVVAVYRVAFEAMARARQGGGPTLIDCKTGGSMLRDPLQLMEEYLTRKGLFTPGWKEGLLERFQVELDLAIKFAEKGIPLKPLGGPDNVYSFNVEDRRKGHLALPTKP